MNITITLSPEERTVTGVILTDTHAVRIQTACLSEVRGQADERKQAKVYLELMKHEQAFVIPLQDMQVKEEMQTDLQIRQANSHVQFCW